MRATGEKERWLKPALFSLLALDLYLVISSWLSIRQIRNQLDSPLIPATTAEEIIKAGRYREAMLAAGLLGLAGCISFMCRYKKTAFFFLASAAVVHQIILRNF